MANQTYGMNHTPYRVLLVEDDRPVARGVARLLMQHGLSVEVASSCAAARLLARHFDLGIFDIELPDGLGVDLARELSVQAQVCAVMFYTGASYQPLLRRAAEMGPVVPKRSGPQALLTAAQTRLSTPRPRLNSGILTEGDIEAMEGFDRPERNTGS